MHLLRYTSPQRTIWAEEVFEQPGAAQASQQSSWAGVDARLQVPGEEAFRQRVGYLVFGPLLLS